MGPGMEAGKHDIKVFFMDLQIVYVIYLQHQKRAYLIYATKKEIY